MRLSLWDENAGVRGLAGARRTSTTGPRRPHVTAGRTGPRWNGRPFHLLGPDQLDRTPASCVPRTPSRHAFRHTGVQGSGWSRRRRNHRALEHIDARGATYPRDLQGVSPHPSRRPDAPASRLGSFSSIDRRHRYASLVGLPIRARMTPGLPTRDWETRLGHDPYGARRRRSSTALPAACGKAHMNPRSSVST